jgi:hypothetical protein
MIKMFNYARNLNRTICHDYYQETCVVLMFLTLLVGIACLLATLAQGTKTSGVSATQPFHVEQRRRQAWISDTRVTKVSAVQQPFPTVIYKRHRSH